MTLVQSQAVSLSSSDLVKMDERKRPASHDHDSSEPPLKRQATSMNGTSKAHVDADMPWRDDLEVRQPCHSRYAFLIFATPFPCHDSVHLRSISYRLMLMYGWCGSDFRKRPYGGRCKNINGSAVTWNSG